MQYFRKLGLSVLIPLSVVVLTIGAVASTRGLPRERDDKDAMLPLTDVHGLMEYVVEGNFEDLKAAVKERPADAKAWRRVYSLSTMLAESGNLLLMRKPDEANAKEWTSLSVGLRKSGGELMKAAKTKDFDATRRTYVAMVESCNQCHAKYGDDGEPKIMP
jgi:hypothetical protein